jgi:hypothetical protein
MMNEPPFFSGEPADDELAVVRTVREAFASYTIAPDAQRDAAIAVGMRVFDELHTRVAEPRATRSWRFAPVVAGIAAAAAAVTLVVSINMSSSHPAKSSATTAMSTTAPVFDATAGVVSPAPASSTAAATSALRPFDVPPLQSLGDFATSGALVTRSTDLVRSSLHPSITTALTTTKDAGGVAGASPATPCLSRLARPDASSSLGLLGSASIAGRPVIVAVYVSSTDDSLTAVLLDPSTCTALNA